MNREIVVCRNLST